ncbi:MAG: transglutaminase family protein [Proteobacteria bacterium]|nr:transglutaminase family protein [Pseudomonadota bacterium]MBI3497766.1 transglutaminase family protein [Pseudomonadota bacterium]
MNRRDFLLGGTALSLGAASSFSAFAQGAPGAFAPKPTAWRRFEVTTRMEIAEAEGQAQAWIPLPSVNEPDWIRLMGSLWTTNAANAVQVRDPRSGAEMLHAVWEKDEAKPVVEVQSRFAARDRWIDLAKPGPTPALSAKARLHYTAATRLLPTDGIVRETARKITQGARSDVDKARLLYAWIVDNTFRDPKIRGCGLGNIAYMLETGNLGGKCADLNALFVGMARASGLPARDLYGIRVAPSKFGYKSLGANSEIITKAQHCRAEVYFTGFGWFPVDPADVRKVVLEEPPGNLALADAMVVNARKTLFGAWETNWLAYNSGLDIVLPGSKGPTLEFLMYPQAETAAGRLDSLDPDAFRYTIKAAELAA